MTDKYKITPQGRIRALANRGVRGGLSPEDSLALCELIRGGCKLPIWNPTVLDRAIILVEEMKDCGGISDEDIIELHGLLTTLKGDL